VRKSEKIGIMVSFAFHKNCGWLEQIPYLQTISAFVFILLTCFCIFAQTDLTIQPGEKTIIVNDAPEMEVYGFGKNVIVKNQAKGVLVFGGDVTVEGNVSGDVAAIGGSVYQTKDAFIGGDVIIFGGHYRPEITAPLRTEGKETVMIAMFEEEIRNFTANPSTIFSPSFSLKFFAQRALSVLFWFIISIGLTTIAPGAVSRSVARFQLIPFKVIGIGIIGFVLTIITVVGALSFLPHFVYILIIPMTLILLLLSLTYGRVALHVIVGKRIAKKLFDEGKQSESLDLVIGVLIWTILLSLPYLWMFGLFILISASVGLVLTAPSEGRWSKS
jgi:hypothetical protein